jgi:hypothetical protein
MIVTIAAGLQPNRRSTPSGHADDDVYRAAGSGDSRLAASVPVDLPVGLLLFVLTFFRTSSASGSSDASGRCTSDHDDRPPLRAAHAGGRQRPATATASSAGCSSRLSPSGSSPSWCCSPT